jgi:uncharacterized protein YndB with AHSA1/START domain
MTHFQTSVRINRPPAEVFAVVADPATYPLWNSAVDDVAPIAGEDGARYTMSRSLPGGPATNVLEVLEAVAPTHVVIQASDGPTPFVYRYDLRGGDEQTVLSLDAEVELDGLFRLAGPLAVRAVKQGVDENFRSLKRLVEEVFPGGVET